MQEAQAEAADDALVRPCSLAPGMTTKLVVNCILEATMSSGNGMRIEMASEMDKQQQQRYRLL